MACADECVFVEEREPGGRLIVGPCRDCGTSVMDALAETKRRAAAPFELRASAELIDALFARCDAGIVALYQDRNDQQVSEIIYTHGNFRIGQGLACAVIDKIDGRARESFNHKAEG